MPRDVVSVVIYLMVAVATAGTAVAGWGFYREIRIPNGGLALILAGGFVLAFAGMVIPVAWRLLSHSA